jgi:hypothetical protein
MAHGFSPHQMMIHSSEPEKSSILQLSTCELRGKGVVGEEAGVQVAQRRPRRDPVYGVPEIIDACLSALILSTTATFFCENLNNNNSHFTHEHHVKMFHVPRNGDPARRRQVAAPESTQLWKSLGEARNLHRPNPVRQTFRVSDYYTEADGSLSVKHALSASGSRW